MDVNLGPFIHDPLDFNDPEKMIEHTKKLAYHFWMKQGQPEGKSDHFWKMAERDIARQKRAFDADLTKASIITNKFLDDLYKRLMLKSEQIQNGTAVED